MTVLNDYQQDVFVSYAHLDDHDDQPWIRTFVHHLRLQSTSRLGRPIRVWMDDELRGNDAITPRLIETVERSATLLIVMSRAYLGSEWCARERNAFLNMAKDRAAEGRVFVVEAWETEFSERPKELQDLKGFPFWVRDPQAGGASMTLGLIDAREIRFQSRLGGLSAQLVEKLMTLDRAPASNAVHAPEPGETVFIARATDDLDEREEELSNYLSQAGIARLPEKWYSQQSESDFRAAMIHDLKRASVYVQLLGKAHGRKPEFGGEQRFPALQAAIARASGKPVLQWRDPNDHLADVADPLHRALLEEARACSFEEFKAGVVELVRRKPPPPIRNRQGVTVFVNADRSDSDVVKQMSDALEQRGVGCFLPLWDGPPESVRKDLEDNLLECDGLIIVYGSTEPSWVRDQLRQGRKILIKRKRELAAMAVFIGPPEQKSDIAVRLPNLMLLDGSHGMNGATLDPFLQRVSAVA
jgi:hypothetical protein